MYLTPDAAQFELFVSPIASNAASETEEVRAYFLTQRPISCTSLHNTDH